MTTNTANETISLMDHLVETCRDFEKRNVGASSMMYDQAWDCLAMTGRHLDRLFPYVIIYTPQYFMYVVDVYVFMFKTFVSLFYDEVTTGVDIDPITYVKIANDTITLNLFDKITQSADLLTGKANSSMERILQSYPKQELFKKLPLEFTVYGYDENDKKIQRKVDITHEQQVLRVENYLLEVMKSVMNQQQFLANSPLLNTQCLRCCKCIYKSLFFTGNTKTTWASDTLRNMLKKANVGWDDPSINTW